MADAEAPIRITKKRANALLTIIEYGIDAERDSIKQEFGVKFAVDGQLLITDDDYGLLDPGQKEELTGRLESLADAIAASQIFHRRYAR